MIPSFWHISFSFAYFACYLISSERDSRYFCYDSTSIVVISSFSTMIHLYWYDFSLWHNMHVIWFLLDVIRHLLGVIPYRFVIIPPLSSWFLFSDMIVSLLHFFHFIWSLSDSIPYHSPVIPSFFTWFRISSLLTVIPSYFRVLNVIWSFLDVVLHVFFKNSPLTSWFHLFRRDSITLHPNSSYFNTNSNLISRNFISFDYPSPKKYLNSRSYRNSYDLCIPLYLQVPRSVGNGNERAGQTRGSSKRRVPARLRDGWLLQQHPHRWSILQLPKSQLRTPLRSEPGSSWTLLPRCLAQKQSRVSRRLPILDWWDSCPAQRRILRHHDPSDPMDSESTNRNGIQELWFMEGKVLGRR